MKTAFLAIALISFYIINAQAKQFAVLVAHSSGYFNYRHQADVFHAYQSLVKNGLDPENIIVFAYDDIANHRYNPFRGKVFNAPSYNKDSRGYNVYNNVKIDYSGKNVTPQKFLAVIKGDKNTAGGKVLTSTDEDNVFIYSSGHGGFGAIFFPLPGFLHFLSDNSLFGNHIVDALKYMHQNKRFKKLVYYMESCQAASVFKTLPKDINVYALTAADDYEASKAAYCPKNFFFKGSISKDYVNGVQLYTCLGDLFSIIFLEHMDKFNLNVETFQNQLDFIKLKNPLSTAMSHGSDGILQEPVGNFQSDPKKFNANSRSTKADWKNWDKWEPHKHAFGSNEVKMEYLKAQQKRKSSKETISLLNAEMASQKRFDTIFKKIKEKFALNIKTFVNKVDFACFEARVELYIKICGPLTEYGLKYTKFIHQTCIQNVKDDAYQFGIETICKKDSSVPNPKAVKK